MGIHTKYGYMIGMQLLLFVTENNSRTHAKGSEFSYGFISFHVGSSGGSSHSMLVPVVSGTNLYSGDWLERGGSGAGCGQSTARVLTHMMQHGGSIRANSPLTLV